MKISIASFSIAFILTAILTVTAKEENPTIEYCSMVKIYKDTAGRSGWPDYNDNYNEVCK